MKNKTTKDNSIRLTIYKELTIDNDVDLGEKEWEWLKQNKHLLEECLEDRLESDCYEYEYYQRFTKEVMDRNV